MHGISLYPYVKKKSIYLVHIKLEFLGLLMDHYLAYHHRHHFCFSPRLKHTYVFLSPDERQWLAPVIIGICALLTPVWGWIAAKNKYTKEVLDTGWTPVISAMLISRLVWLLYSIYTWSSSLCYAYSHSVGFNIRLLGRSMLRCLLHKNESAATTVKMMADINTQFVEK